MATYYVDGNANNDSGDGSSNRPWKTLSKAADQTNPNDEVRVRSATYREVLTIRVANTTWKADTGHTPIIDGGYHDGLFRNDETLPHPEPGSGYLPDNNTNLVTLRAANVVFDGFTVQNSAAKGIGVSESNCVVRNCRLDFIYGGGIAVNPTGAFIDNVVVENNILTRISVRYYDPLRSGAGPESVAGVIKMGQTRDGVIRNNVCAYGHGEGINIGKASYRTLVEGNIVHTCNHVHIYVNRSVDVTVRNNLVYHLYIPVFVGNEDRPPGGIAFGDENAPGNWVHSSGGQVYNNIVVGLGTLFGVRNNAINYDTQLVNCYVGYNTFIGASKTEQGISITGNLQGRAHRNSLIENNVIYGADRISNATGDISGVTFRNNLWSEQPVAAMRGNDDRIGNPNLVNPTAALRDNFPNPNSNIDPQNYRLTERSALAIGRASQGQPANGVQPPNIGKDFFGANRDNSPDIGAHEYDGEVSNITANFSIGPAQGAGQTPHTVDFTDKSSAAQPVVAYLWDFGDGNTSTEVNPSHTYSSAGTYDVTLTVTDSNGNSDSLTRDDLIAVTEETSLTVPGSFRRFVLVRSEPRQVLAYGTQYPDLRCVVIWHEDPFHMLNFADIDDVEQNLATIDGTALFWFDPSDQDETIDEAEVSEATVKPVAAQVRR